MFLQPHSVEEALALKREYGPDACFLAGGTDVIVMLNHGRLPAKVFIDLTQVPGMDGIADLAQRSEPGEGGQQSGSPSASGVSGKAYVAGGGATFAQLARLPIYCLAEASLSVGGPQIRNRGTIAGNLATASPAGDGSTALLALDAEVELRNVDRARRMPLREFFLDYRKTAMEPDEMITSVTFPAEWKTGWYKLGKRGAMNISLVCCAVGLSEQRKFHVAFGSVGPYPLRAPKTEEFLTREAAEGGEANGAVRLSDAAIGEAEKMAASEVRPIDDFRGSEAYRRAMSGALLRKALRQICS